MWYGRGPPPRTASGHSRTLCRRSWTWLSGVAPGEASVSMRYRSGICSSMAVRMLTARTSGGSSKAVVVVVEDEDEDEEEEEEEDC